MIFLKIAFLNIRKHVKRTLLIIGAVALSVTVLVLVSGLFEGLRTGFFEKMLSSSGHLQVEAEGRSDALDPYSLEQIIHTPEPIMQALREDPRVTQLDSLIAFGALLIHERENVAMQGHGIAPETPYFEDVREGLLEGSFLRDDGEILVSRSTADLLSLELGGPAVVLTEDSTGSPFYMEYTVAGLYDTDSQELDESAFFITRNAAQELLYVDEGVTQIRANLTDRALADSVAVAHRAAASEAGGEIRTWREIHGSFTVLLEFFDIFMLFMNLLVVIVAATVITNAILMNVFEKAGEYGTMRAIGMKRKQHFLLVLTEGSVQGALGSIAGLLVGVPLTLYFQFNGIYIGAASDAFGLGRTIYTLVRPEDVLISLLAGILTAVAGSLYAALVNVRSPVVELLKDA